MKTLLAAFLFLATAGLAHPAPPNIVIFLSDDHTWRDSSLYGSTEIKTPHMERLAADGMTFDRAYVNSPACAPARAALLTGLYPARSGAEANHSRPGKDIRKLPAYLKQLGMVYAAAREKFGDDLFFLHTSDHGAQWPFAKWNLYEDGIRTPLIATWPGKIKPATRSDAMVSWIDILPTLVAAAGGEPPAEIDGRSILPVLLGEKDSHREFIFATHSGDGNHNVYPIRSVRSTNGWKYIRNLHPEFLFTSHVTSHAGDSGYWAAWLQAAISDPLARERVLAYQQRQPAELYQLDSDPWETNNLIADPAHAERAATLARELDAWMAETEDPQQVFGIPRTIAAPGKPNIITVFVDDMGWTDLSCFGGEDVETEAIDRLASEGIRFRQFYVNSPICSPSRVALTTGQYPQRWRITSFLNNRRNNNERGMAQWLDPAAPVLARRLQRAGYATGHLGKWHMGGQRDVANAPHIRDYGFDSSLTNFEGMGRKLLPLTLTPDSDQPGRIWEDAEKLGGPATWMQRSTITGGFVSAAIGFIDQAAALDRLFFVNVWPDDPHSPFFPPLERWGPDKRSRYLAVIDAMDEQLAPLFDRIRNDPKLRENTLILFCSDNGHEIGAGKSDPLRAGKTWLYDGGIRSPLIVWGPGLLAEKSADSVNDTSVFSAIDINRSLYTLTGTSLPENQTLDGEDVLDTLLGKSVQSRQAPIFFRRPPDRPGNDPQWGLGDNPDLAVRHGQWKFLINYDGSNPQLYDIIGDPSESENLVADFPEVATRLSSAITEWNATLPPDAGDPAFKPAQPSE